MAALKYIDAAQDVSEVLAELAVSGACIVTGLLAPSTCDALLDDFRPHLDEQQWGTDELGYRDEFYGSQTKRLHGLFSKSRLMADVLTHPLLLAIAEGTLMADDRARDVRLSNTELMVLGKDQGNQMFHTDAGSWHRAQQYERPGEIVVSANIALTEFRATNGATRVVPGSHLWPADRQPLQDEICLATMPQGSALIYTGNAVHSGGANEEAEQRVGLYLGYVVSWLRPIENYFVTNDAEDIVNLPERAKRLLDISEGGFTVMA